MEADLLQYYDLDLGDVFRGLLTVRRARVLIGQLPAESRTAVATHGTDALWDLQANLTAVVADELRVANWQRANEGRKTPSPYPKPLPRPGLETKRKRKGMALEDIKEWMAQMNAPEPEDGGGLNGG